MDQSSPAPQGTTRRAALRAGAAVAWTVPVVTVLGTSAAHADLASGPGGGTVPPPPGGGTVPPPATVPPSALPSQVPTPPAPAATTTTAAPSVAAAPAARGQVLAATGADALPLGVAGLGLVAGGAAVVAASRRGRSDSADDAQA